MSFSTGARMRCMGPWPRCGHAEGICTASPDYQAAIKASAQPIRDEPKPDHLSTITALEAEVGRLREALTAQQSLSVLQAEIDDCLPSEERSLRKEQKRLQKIVDAALKTKDTDQ